MNEFDSSRESTVPSSYNNTRIDKYLSSRFTYYSRNEWQREITAGRVTCNESAVSTHKIVKTGDIVKYDSIEIDEPHVDTKYGILYEDEWIIAADKPGNLPVHPSGRFYRNTLQTLLEQYAGIKLHPIHRLDRETSGVVLFGKNSAITSAIHKNFDQVKKTYIAIVYGEMKDKAMCIDMPIGSNENGIVRKRRIAHSDADESAVTHIKKLFCFGNYTLIKAMPVTGRLHQIRVHCNHAGLPIVGDKIYGLDENLFIKYMRRELNDADRDILKMQRSALHSRSIRFYHPQHKKYMLIKAPLPDDMREFILSNRV